MPNLKTLLLTLSILIFNNCFAQSISPVWSSFYQGSGDNSDRYNSIVSDGSGNFIAVGYTIRPGNYRDFLVAKLDANGDTLWTRTKNGKNAGDDEAIASVVDGSGNVFVVGYSDGGNSNHDVLLIKYDNLGNRLFDTTWNSVYFYDDIPVAIALDNSGNIIIGANSEPDTVSGSNHYITLKYSPNGALQWMSEFSRAGVKHELTALAVDASGDVYVTGRSASASDDDFATLKYSGSNGTQLWIQVYNSGNGNDRATALALDNAGNVIVTGRSKGSSNDDFRTVKYSSAGVLQWSKFYNAPANQDDRALAIAVDAADNVYVAGQSDVDNSSSINYDYAVVKYNSAGTQQWSKLTGSVFMQDDIVTAIKADASGNVFITGKSDQDPGTSEDNDWMTVMYNTAGSLIWTQNKNGSSLGNGDTPGGLILSGSDCLVVGSIENTGSQKDAACVKYDASGAELFTRLYNGEGDFEESARSIIIDSNEIAYTCGYFFHQDQNRNGSIVQTNGAGDTVCAYTYNGIKNDDDELYDLVLSPGGKIYAIGYTKVSGQKSNFLLVKYDPATCDTIWTRTYDYIGQSDKAENLVLDAAGNIYVTGRSDSSPVDFVDNNDIVTIKYDTNGNQLWIQRFNGSGNMRDEPSQILINGNGEVVVCGRTENVHDDDFIVIKYDGGTGAPVWASPAIYAGPFANDDRALDMTIDASDNIYVCGYSQTGSSPANEDPVVLKYDNGGNLMGFYSYVALGEDQPLAIAHDLTGNVFVAFRTDVDPDPLVSNFDFLTMKFDTDLNPLWATPPQYDSPINQDDEPSDILVSPNGDIYVTGTSENDSSGGRINKNWLTLVYGTGGNQLAIANYDGPNGTDDAANAIAIRGNSFWVCGYTEGTNNSQRNNTVLRYNLIVGINEVSGLLASSIYPNPFTQSATLTIENADNGSHTMIITDIAGAVVSENNFSGNTTVISKGSLAAGVYYYSVSDKSDVISRGKFIIN